MHLYYQILGLCVRNENGCFPIVCIVYIILVYQIYHTTALNLLRIKHLFQASRQKQVKSVIFKQIYQHN